MSGIVVVIGEGADRYTFGRMMYALARRGDGPETLLRNGLLAGTQRSREPGRPESRQPWCSPDGELLICFDGELTDPGRLAVAPAGAGDAEVALAAFRRWGDAAVTRLRGEYALVIVQRATRRAYLARDPMGVRPLYWSVHDTELHVASEVKALVPADVRIHEVPPGHHGWAAKGRPPELRAFFEAPELSLGRAPVTGPYTAATQLRAGLRDAVTGGLPATGRVGVLLSGGIDSAAVLAAVRELAPDCVAFTAGTPDSPDVVGARRLADRLGVAHEVIELRPEDIGYDQVREAVRTGELTEYGDIANAIVTLPLLRRVRERGIRVVFTGDGADELFGGYPGYHGITPEKVRQLFRYKLANLGRGDLHRLDRVGAACGVRARVPFLDPTLVGLAVRLPLRLKLRDGQEKWVVRAAFADVLPDDTRERPRLAMSRGSGLYERIRLFRPLFARLHRRFGYDLLAPVRRDFDEVLAACDNDLPRALAEQDARHDYTLAEHARDFTDAVKIRIEPLRRRVTGTLTPSRR